MSGFLPLGTFGNSVGGTANTSARVLSDVEIIHRNGAVMSSPPATRRPMRMPLRTVRIRRPSRSARSSSAATAAAVLIGNRPIVAATGNRLP